MTRELKWRTKITGRSRRNRLPQTATRAGASSALAVAALLVVIQPAVGQPRSRAERFGPPAQVTLTLFAAAFSPLGNITRDPDSFGTSISSSGAFGGSASYWLGNGHFGLGLLGAYAPADLELLPTVGFQGTVPSDLGSAGYFAGTVTFMYRLLPSGAASAMQPYIGLGGGLRHLAVEAIAEPEVEDVTDPVFTVVGGSTMWLSRRLAVHIEVRDFLSVFDSPTTGVGRLQNDVLISVGLAARLK